MVLLVNDRMVDGHHYTGTADFGKVSSSLHVLDLTPTRFQMEGLHPRMIELRRQYGTIAKDAAVGGIASAAGTGLLLAGTGLGLKKKAPELAKALGTAARQHIAVFNPVRTAAYMRSLPAASRIFGKQIRGLGAAEEIVAGGKIPSLESVKKVVREIPGLQDIKNIGAFKAKYGRTPSETMEKSVGLLSGVAATGAEPLVGPVSVQGGRRKGICSSAAWDDRAGFCGSDYGRHKV
jgi:hypothetical protein